MKKIYLIIIISLVAFSLQAQFLMESNTHILRAGDEHHFIIAKNVDPGIEGASVVWNFN